MPEPWWKTAVIYQIYPRSFADANGDGVGDLRGILDRLPHLLELGVDAVWISPIFPSPMADFGYDISDYTAIDPLFGSLEEFDALLETMHRHGLKLLLDLVPNHTSDRHPWFAESRASRNSARRDWYLWRDAGPGGAPPNNWLSEFGGSAWEFDAATGQYYYHAFLKEQPDLNWRNPAVAEAMREVMRFWLRRGVDGFRVDVLWHLIKDSRFRDNPANPDYKEGDPPHRRVVPLFTTDLPEVHDVVRELRQTVDEFAERVLIGEIYLPIERLVAYYGRDLTGVHLPFNFSLLQMPWNARAIARVIEDYEAALPPGGWPNWVLGNHDVPRIAGRIGREQARLAAMLLLTLRGTPTVYYGDEIAIPQVAVPAYRVQDPYGKRVPGQGRDGARTPMHWDAGERAGFSTVEPWLPLAPDHRHENVANQRGDSGSIYNLYRRLIAARRRHPALALGAYRPIVAGGDLLLYAREHDGERILLALNLGAEPAAVTFPSALCGTVLVSAQGDREGERIDGEIDLRVDEGLAIVLSDDAVIPRRV